VMAIGSPPKPDRLDHPQTTAGSALAQTQLN
jgi:hypothetical protein